MGGEGGNPGKKSLEMSFCERRVVLVWRFGIRFRRGWRHNKQQIVPRDAGLLEVSTGMGLSLSLLVAAVSQQIAKK
ncbi:hypothetical protein SLA2020_483770 [Shorea laevis]